MKKILFIMLLACSTLLSGNALAAKVKCEPAKFDRLYQNGDTVYVRIEGLPWHKLGIEGDNDLDKKSIVCAKQTARAGMYNSSSPTATKMTPAAPPTPTTSSKK